MRALPYEYDALEPVLSGEAMGLHYDVHHKGYEDKLREALRGSPQLLRRVGGLYNLLGNPKWIPREVREEVVDFGGGVWNHDFYWRCLSPNARGYDEGASVYLRNAVEGSFGGYEKLREGLIEGGLKQFGSGWVWLVDVGGGDLRVYSTLNQNTPMMRGHKPLLTIDVWEHAYYLDYGPKREDFLVSVVDHLIDWGRI